MVRTMIIRRSRPRRRCAAYGPHSTDWAHHSRGRPNRPTRGGFRSSPHARLGPSHQALRRRLRRSQWAAARIRERTPRAAVASRDCARPRPQPFERRRGRVASVRPRRGGTREARAHGLHESGRYGRRDRSRRCATACLALGAAVQRPSRTSHSEALAALVAATLQREPAGPCAHSRAETVCSRSLALLRLIGAFHDSRARGGSRASIRSGLTCKCDALEHRPRGAAQAVRNGSSARRLEARGTRLRGAWPHGVMAVGT